MLPATAAGRGPGNGRLQRRYGPDERRGGDSRQHRRRLGVRERPHKGPKPALSLPRIVDAAVRVADAEGLDAVPMGRVAAELGAAPLSLYRHMTPRAIGFIVDRRRLAAKLPRLAPHDFRRTFAGSLLNEGVDLLRVQQLMGHSSPVTTSLYDRRPSEQRKAAVDLLHLPSPDELSVTSARRTT